MLTTCDMAEIRSKGDRFTWVGERHNHTVKCCLDRAFINSEWRALYPNSEAEFLDFAGSYHKPITVYIGTS